MAGTWLRVVDRSPMPWYRHQDDSANLRKTSDVHYDTYDVDIIADPYPVFRRLREEAPLYFNERFDFYAVSRFDDVERGLLDRKTFISDEVPSSS
jgi:cytochrome P450